MEKHRLSFFQKKLRSLAKRALAPLVNQSESYIVQHLPESIGREGVSFAELRNLWIENNHENNDVDLVRLLFLLSAVEEVQNVPGAFAELGVYKGNSAKLFAHLAPERKLYLFDTFQGFHSSDLEVDPKKVADGTHFLDTSLQGVKEFVGERENIVYCPGYFPETAEAVSHEERFALVHLDADLYKPTLAALHYFYPRLAPGAFVILHDYSSGAWPGVRQAVDEFLKDKPEKLIPIPDKSGTAAFRYR